MTAFTFDPEAHRSTFLEKGWVHVRDGASPELLDELQALLGRSRARDPLRGQGLAGEKEQHLFEAADMDGFCRELFDVVSVMCDLDRERMTLSERHLKLYDDDADPDPAPHKDRFASQVSVGISIDIPSESRLLLYPDVDRRHNRFLTTEHKARLAPEERPEVTLRDARPVELADRPGDVVLFYGSAMWHLRRNSAGAALLYLKCNDFDCDPLGEDPTTPLRRARTLEVTTCPADHAVDELVPVPARRLQSVTLDYGRDWQVDRWLTVFTQPSVRVSEAEVEILRDADGFRTVAEVAPDDERRAALLRLAAAEGLDLLDRPYRRRAATASAMASVDAAGSAGERLRS